MTPEARQEWTRQERTAFARNLRMLRQRVGLQTRDLAALAGLHDTAISGWERETRKALPKLPILFRLALALSAGLDELVAGLSPDYDRQRAVLAEETRRLTQRELDLIQALRRLADRNRARYEAYFTFLLSPPTNNVQRTDTNEQH